MKTKIKYRSGYKYQLAKTFEIGTRILPPKKVSMDFIVLSRQGKLTIKRNYAWDGQSGPTIDTKNFMRGSLVHDALYQLMRLKLLPMSYREGADMELDRICKLDGMSRIRRWYVLRSLRRFGASAANPENKKKLLEAP